MSVCDLLVSTYSEGKTLRTVKWTLRKYRNRDQSGLVTSIERVLGRFEQVKEKKVPLDHQSGRLEQTLKDGLNPKRLKSTNL